MIPVWFRGSGVYEGVCFVDGRSGRGRYYFIFLDGSAGLESLSGFDVRDIRNWPGNDFSAYGLETAEYVVDEGGMSMVLMLCGEASVGLKCVDLLYGLRLMKRKTGKSRWAKMKQLETYLEAVYPDSSAVMTEANLSNAVDVVRGRDDVVPGWYDGPGYYLVSSWVATFGRQMFFPEALGTHCVAFLDERGRLVVLTHHAYGTVGPLHWEGVMNPVFDATFVGGVSGLELYFPLHLFSKFETEEGVFSKEAQRFSSEEPYLALVTMMRAPGLFEEVWERELAQELMTRLERRNYDAERLGQSMIWKLDELCELRAEVEGRGRYDARLDAGY